MNHKFKISEENIDKLIDTICRRLSEGKRIRRTLPGGRIHIDRPLPFLCVYRQPHKFKDEGTKRLIMGEASYLIVTGDPKFQKNIEKLIQNIVRILSSQFGGFLILEVWAAREITFKLVKGSLQRPTFRVFTDKSEYSSFTPMFSKFENFLKKIRILKVGTKVEMSYGNKLTPQDLPLLLNKNVIKELGCHIIGLEVQPVYRGRKGIKFFPLVLQTLHRGLSRALKNLFFDFVQDHTTHHTSNYQALGRRAVVKAVWDVDSRLAEVGSAFDFLMLITPVNAALAWEQFKNSKFKETPVFYYRPLPLDPAVVKRNLYNIPIERIEDPTLSYLFREKQSELGHCLNMLTDRGTKRFLFSNLQLYGNVDNNLTNLAQNILKEIPTKERKENTVKSNVFLQKVESEINYYKRKYPQFNATAEINESIPGIMVVRENLLIGNSAKISASRSNALIQHEVGTHLVTYFNGRAQPLKQLYSGLAGYEELQEGLAVLAEYLSGEFTPSRLRTLAARVMAAISLTDGKSFVETFHALVDKFKFDTYHAFRITFRIYRAGGSIKDIIYLRGLQKIIDYIKNGGYLDPLFVGKFGFSHIPIIKELLSRKIVRSPILKPRFLAMPGVSERLERIKNGITIYQLTERRFR